MPQFNRHFGREVALSQIDLTTTERVGSLAVDYGLVPARRHQVPADFPHWSLSYMAKSHPSPKPSVRRSAPRRSPPQSAA